MFVSAVDDSSSKSEEAEEIKNGDVEKNGKEAEKANNEVTI